MGRPRMTEEARLAKAQQLEREAAELYAKARAARGFDARAPLFHKAAQLRCQARRFATPRHATNEQIAARVAFYGGRCAYCGAPYTDLDHAIPIAQGGSNWPANLRPACKHCNVHKWGSSL